MKFRPILLLICMSIPLSILGAFLQLAMPQKVVAHNATTQGSIINSQILTTELQATLSNQSNDEPIRFMIHFKKDAQLQAIAALPAADRGTAVVNQLQATANQAQATTLRQLDQLQQAGQIESYRQLWIINAISVIGQPESVAQLASDPQIEKIDEDTILQTFDTDFDAFNIESFAIATQPVTQTIKNWGITHAKVDHVWHGLGINGAGVVVGIIDSGIDYSHPDLLPNYRGNLGNGLFDHSDSWYYAANPTVITAPIDLQGHGTHVAGIAIGQNGVGVAPGSQWIGVGIADENGTLFDSNAIVGLQWLIAPNGDPSAAPDVINGSWGDENGSNDSLVEAIEALKMAGIIPIFSSGNSGPASGTIGSPASYSSTFSVGAHDEDNFLAWFSSRGPSPFFDGPLPHLVAPGTAILSTFPNEQYAIASGTSMAAPQTTGAVALYLSQDPNISNDALFELLTDTAVAITNTHPNPNSGWGRLDAYNLVSQIAAGGTLQGQITDDNGPVSHLSFSIETATGYQLQFETDANGNYEAYLQAGVYSLYVEKFGYEPAKLNNISINLNQTIQKDIHLTQLPRNLIHGQIRSAIDNIPLENVTITVEGVDLALSSTDDNGFYQISLPYGQFKLEYTLLGYQIQRQAIVVQSGPAQQIDLTFEPSERVLLVDSGQWYYGSKISFYESVLHDLNYPTEIHQIRNPFNDIPTIEKLSQFDTVIWSDPAFSPGFIGASRAITGYLESGGHLIISGQNVALFDSTLFGVAWWHQYLKVDFLGQRTITQPIAGALDTPFAGMSLGINGPGSAKNQFALDGVRGRAGTFAEPIFYYADGDPAGVGVGHCEDYNLVFLGFGLEGVSYSFSRAVVIDRLFEYLDEPDDLVGLRWLSDDLFDFGVPGEAYSYTLNVQNVSEIYTDTISINIEGATWQTSVMTPTMTLGPCESAQTVVTITVPEEAPKNERHEMKVTAVSHLNPASKESLDFEHKVPGHILLVDDDRWYDQELLYQKLLIANDLPPDIWETTRSIQDFSPPLELMLEYDFIIWYTAYDWFQPIKPQERESIQAYLDSGGRLFLTSQDFMYYHHNTPLAQDYFGAIGYYESASPTAMFGGGVPGYSRRLSGPLALTFDNYLNFSDGLIPSNDSEVLFWHNAGLPAVVGHQGENYRAVLMSVPLEKLPSESQEEFLNHMVGWISDLGGSSIVVDNRATQSGQSRIYTITIQNATIAPTNLVTMSNVLTSGLNLNEASLTGGAVYDAGSHTISWQGELESGETKLIVYEATPDAGLPTGTAVENSVTFSYARHLVAFDSYATTWMSPPDLQTSSVSLEMNRPVVPDRITFTLWITNTGFAVTEGVTAVVYLPDHIYPLTSTLTAPFGTPSFDAEKLIWAGDLNPGQSISASLAFTRRIGSLTQHIQTAAAFEDGVTGAILVPFEAFLQPYRYFFSFAAYEVDE